MRSYLKIAIGIFIIFISSIDSYSQFVNFGRNKVQYADFEWSVLSTEHFKIYYYQDAKELAEIGANYAEESYREHQEKFKHSLVDTVPMIFYTSPLHFKQTNTTPGLIPDGVGGFFEFIKGRVVIPFEGSLSQFRHVIKHELVHVFMMSKIGNVQKTHRKSIGAAPPLWFTEGLAEYWSTQWDTQADMVLKDAVLTGYLPGLSNWERVYGTYLMYKLGQKVLEYIALNFGEDKILQLIDNFWVDENFSNVMQYTLGVDYAQFDKNFLYWLEKQYYPEYKDLDDPSAVSENIYTESFAHKPTYSNANGNQEVFFIGNKTGFTSIFKLNLRKLSDGADLVIGGESSDEFEQFHFFRTGIDVSSTGNLAFITQKGNADALHILNTRTNEVIADYSFPDIVSIGSPSWSHDGNKITFPATDFGGINDLYILDLLTNELTRLTNDYYDDRDPDFSPDGDHIVFSSDRTTFGKKKAYNLFIYEIKTGRIDYLTIGDQIDYAPNFSEDGTKIIFTSDINGPQNIWMIDLKKAITSEKSESGTNALEDKSGINYDDLEMRQITYFISAAYDPKWSGKDRIVFSSFEKGSISIKMLRSIQERFDSSKNVVKTNIKEKGENWTADKIKSYTNKNNVPYKKDFSLDIATTALTVDPVFGANTGGIISLSDLLGNEKYYFLIFNNSNGSEDFWNSFNIAISKISIENRLNYAYGIYHLSGRRYDLGEFNSSFYERQYGGYLSLAYPLSFFRRLEMTTSLSQSTRSYDLFDNTRSLLLSNFISYVKDNTLWNYTGPMDGERLNLTLGYTTDIANSNINYYSLFFDFRKYFRLGGPTALALRTQFFMNEGKEERRFFMGGSWSLRGWPLNSIRGSKLWQTNLELRFPLLNVIALRFPLGIGFDFPGIQGAVYFDAGNAWDRNYTNVYTNTYTRGSIGAGIRLNALGLVVLRYDFGKRIEENFTKLQGDFYQNFYFGYNF
ncbi:MAG TPA: BamA/TamA family outer membrane protein [Ignavibacteria bacterium]|nr:BamA/TamA family outer membrane protein [Ignavibacteria bacterium]HRB00777.1 BamA/TamA family outer membrane protein [Ignavibacteria bacterium]